jgi:hypothetical protein
MRTRLTVFMMQLDDFCEECQQHDDRQRHTQKPQNTGSSHFLLPLCCFLAHLTHQSMSEFLKRPRSSIAAQGCNLAAGGSVHFKGGEVRGNLAAHGIHLTGQQTF